MGTTQDVGITLDDREAEALRFYLTDIEAMYVDVVARCETEFAEWPDDDGAERELTESRDSLDRTRARLALLDSDPARFIQEETDTVYAAYDDIEGAWRSCSHGDVWPGCGAGENMVALDRVIAHLGLLRRLELARAEA